MAAGNCSRKIEMPELDSHIQTQTYLLDKCSIETFENIAVKETTTEFSSKTMIENPWSTVDTENLKIQISQPLVQQWKYKLPGVCCSILKTDEGLLATLEPTNTLLVLSLTGELLSTKKYPEDVKCLSIHKLTDTELLLATTEGLYIVDSTSLDIKEQIYSRGEVRYPYVNKGEIVGLDVTNNELIILKCLGGRKLTEKHVKLQGYEIDPCNTVVKHNDVIYVASWNNGTLYSCNASGEFLAQYGGEGATHQLDTQDPWLQGVDSQGNIVWVEEDRKRLKLLKSSGEVEVIDLSNCVTETIITIVHICNNNMWVVAAVEVGSSWQDTVYQFKL